MACSRGHAVPPLSQVARSFGASEEVLAAYVVGSHAWGSCHAHSDWDLILVMKKVSGVKPVNAHRGCFEALLLSKEDWEDMIQQHSLQVLPTLWLPRELVLKETFDPKACFHFNPDTLRQWLGGARERDVRVAAKHFGKDDRHRAKRVLLHCLRCLEFGVQLCREGRIVDFSAGGVHRGPVLDCQSPDWEELLALVQPLMEQLWGSLTTND